VHYLEFATGQKISFSLPGLTFLLVEPQISRWELHDGASHMQQSFSTRRRGVVRHRVEHYFFLSFPSRFIFGSGADAGQTKGKADRIVFFLLVLLPDFSFSFVFM
jgi:hypothetical protein